MTDKRIWLAVFGLTLAMVAAAADAPTPVVVDPTDFRKPVPDPEQGLSDKYDGKTVRFSGVVRRFSIDKRTKHISYELHYDIMEPAKAPPTQANNKVAVRPRGRPATPQKPAMVVAETITVAVSFTADPRNLQRDVRRDKKGVPLTVQGTAHVQSDGTLTITGATVVSSGPFSDR